MTPHEYLEKYFGFREFLDAQEEVINTIVDGADALVVMLTGGGQIALLSVAGADSRGDHGGRLSAHRALMKDQVDRARAAWDRRHLDQQFARSPAEQQERIRCSVAVAITNSFT